MNCRAAYSKSPFPLRKVIVSEPLRKRVRIRQRHIEGALALVNAAISSIRRGRRQRARVTILDEITAWQQLQSSLA